MPGSCEYASSEMTSLFMDIKKLLTRVADSRLTGSVHIHLKDGVPQKIEIHESYRLIRRL